MIRLKINNREIEVADGTTILQACESLGIHVPSMCYRKDIHPMSSCMLCLVKIKDRKNLVPSCSALAENNMEIITDSDEVIIARKKSLELLLSEHAGDCIAPCQRTCPLHIDIPNIMRHIQKKEFEKAYNLVIEGECNQQCEKACRRKLIDQPVSIKSAISFLKKKYGNKLSKTQAEKISSCSIIRKLTEEELKNYKKKPGNDITDENSLVKESYRCLHCDCRKKEECSLKKHSLDYEARQVSYPGERMKFRQFVFKNYVYEPGKCIKCGICTAISKLKGVKNGFTFYNRGFDVEIKVPYEEYENSELLEIIDICIENCPTGALAAYD